jgi:hypothetical protein
MAASWEFDPVSEDAANANLLLAPTDYYVLEFNAPMPQPDVLYASSVDTEGENPASTRPRNRTVTMAVDVFGREALSALEFKVAKLIREKGTLLYTLPGGEEIIFDVLSVDSFEFPHNHNWDVQEVANVTLGMTCKPLGRGPEVDLGDNTETTLPWLVFTEADVPGTWPALGRLVIDNDASADQWWVVWGIQSRYYSSSASAALAWQAESLTAMGGSATNTGPSGASGSSVMRNTALSTTYQAILSTQATGGGAHMSHVGSFRVYARVQAPTTNSGTVSVAFEWGEGDFRRFTQNTTSALSPSWEGTWRLVDLGLVTLTRTVSGTQRWEGRIVAKSTTPGDDIDVDCLLFVPVDEGSGEASAVQRLASTSAFSARDEFDLHSAGALAGKTAPTGGVWAEHSISGATAFQATGTVARINPSGTNARSVRLPVSLGDSFIQADVSFDSLTTSSGPSGLRLGLLLRYVDSSNYAAAVWWDEVTFTIFKVIGGSLSVVADTPSGTLSANTSYTMRAVMLGAQVLFYVGPAGSDLSSPVVIGSDSVFATGGTLATGAPGIYDFISGGGTTTRDYNNFSAASASADAAIYASQSLEVRHNRADREDSGGTIWQTPTRYTGDYLLVPPAGAEGRTSRLIVKASRGIPGEFPDAGVDDISARLYVTPRYLAVPDA